MVCPICDTQSDNNRNCSNCNWEFVYFSEEPTFQQKKEYNEKMFLYAKDIAGYLMQQNEPYDFFVAKALTFKPDIDLYLTLINFYVEKQEFDFALELALESLKLTPCPMAYLGVAACYTASGQYTTALEYAKKAIEFDPTLPMDYIFGNIYRGLNQQNKAIEHYEKYLLTINPNDEDIKKYIKDTKAQVNTAYKTQDNQTQKEEIIKLTPKILEKGMFENTSEYINRINNLAYVFIGYAKFGNYDADKQILEFDINIDKELINYFNEAVKKTLCHPSQKFKTKINQNNAKKLYHESSLKIISKIKIVDKKFTIIDILLNEHNFFREYNPLLKKEEDEQRFKENFMKNIPKTWIYSMNEETDIEWEIILDEESITLEESISKYTCKTDEDFYKWFIVYDNESLISQLKNSTTRESKYILEYIYQKNEVIWAYGRRNNGNYNENGWTFTPRYLITRNENPLGRYKVRRCRYIKKNNNTKQNSTKSFFSKIFS